MSKINIQLVQEYNEEIKLSKTIDVWQNEVRKHWPDLRSPNRRKNWRKAGQFQNGSRLSSRLNSILRLCLQVFH